MPTKRTAIVMHLSDLEFWELFAFSAGCWSPGHCAGTRWRTWAEYFETYELVRAEFLAASRNGWPPIAEFTRAHFLAGRNPTDGRADYDDAYEAFTKATKGRPN